MSRLMITGASGFVGQSLIQHAQASGQDVLAVSRHAPTDASASHLAYDLGASGSVAALTPALGDVSAVIHAAARFSGSPEEHARDTVQATRHLVQAMSDAGAHARLILVSSLSVYDVAAMQDWATLNEDTPLLTDNAQRDAYGAAKAEQEQVARSYAGPLTILRPGAIYGPHRLWSAQLGFAKAGLVVCPGGDALLPAIHVDHVAQALLNAVQGAAPDIANLIDPNPPQQSDWLRALDQRVLYVPRGLVLAAGKRLGRGASWQARFRPLQYDTSRAQAMIPSPEHSSFADAVDAARTQERL
ncbi:MAG: NAD(P)-dependent oxidoreductase [Aliishimia sp.]